MISRLCNVEMLIEPPSISKKYWMGDFFPIGGSKLEVYKKAEPEVFFFINSPEIAVELAWKRIGALGCFHLQQTVDVCSGS